MTKYVCRDCNYRFESRETNECMFCGMGNIELEKSAGELLDDVDRLLKS